MIKDVDHCELSLADQDILARWAVKTSIMMQFTDLSTKTSHPDDDVDFYQSGRALDVNRVWLGRHVGTQWDRRFFHANAVVGDRRTGQIVDMWGTTTIVIDSLVVFVLWDAPGLLGPKFPYSSEMVSIWPAVDEVEWPPTCSFADGTLSEAAVWVQKAAGQHFMS
ncbi:hypothetical protein [Nocardia jiangxiensis]|uniref:hypothetical protein n=1 Tax=Nocardia jiangxiensis TaxID=282685 RepID=UPI00146D3E81|nr:hypothetical protein [Nocardia jiangxiensis]